MHLGTRHSERTQSQQQEGQTEEEVTDIPVFLQVDQDDAQEEGGIDGRSDVKRHTGRHDPRRKRRSDIGAHDD